MKINSKKYALAFLAAIENKSKAEINKVMKDFVILLAKNNVLGQTDKILQEIVKILDERAGIISAQVTSARVLSSEMKKNIIEKIKDLTDKKEVVLETNIDIRLIGGLVMRYQDKVWDSSLKTKINNLRSKIAK